MKTDPSNNAILKPISLDYEMLFKDIIINRDDFEYLDIIFFL